ncbi:hypothetical protein GGE16_004690 [Rhizobium leguminosarum]|uniref:Uncharacterized protein n=1 Tax=Rhizobium leguminosarum TaxID=384 RepID=A0AAE2MNI9_RHILE|nr:MULTISPECIES: hypothetical protein [Rhizobium]MBB4292611.1 hypothetical protein [Rhizobium leguminosarum]MBB4298849.1 hypothetical protein [Rhizobium leguminosarum]MBB4310178.1 hypothetical protein [Rhizobium leguminosarum]MBB4434440.1 hypothetical protein [Rhizobium esperanzae]MBB4531336.1 hypothetical protein [Rhizobium leguminosarum]
MAQRESNWSHFDKGCATIFGTLAFKRITPSDAARQRIAEGIQYSAVEPEE